MESSGTRGRRIELLATTLLAAAALATAWSTFQSGRWRGLQASNTGKSTAARVQSSQASTRAGQLTQIDIATFIQWVNAETAGNRKLAGFYRRRFRPEFRPAFDAWLAAGRSQNPRAPSTPFAMPQYRPAESEQAKQLESTAELRLAAAGRANQERRRLPPRARALRLVALLRRHLHEGARRRDSGRSSSGSAA